MSKTIVILLSIIAGCANASDNLKFKNLNINELKSSNLNIKNSKSENLNIDKIKPDNLSVENLKYESPNIEESKSESLNMGDLKSKNPNVWNLKSSTHNDYYNQPEIFIEFNCKSGKTYKIDYRAGSSGSWTKGDNEVCSNSGNNIGSINNYGIQPVACSTEYEIRVKRKNSTKWYRVNQKTLPCYSSPNPVPDTNGTFRLKQVTTNKCIYGYQTPGTTNNNAYTWSCYQNPGMAFKIQVHPTTGKKKLQHQESKDCLTVNSNTNGARASLVDCQYANTFILEPVTGNIVRLKAEGKNKCLYGLSQNGQPVHAWGCWNDPSMNFVLEPY